VKPAKYPAGDRISKIIPPSRAALGGQGGDGRQRKAPMLNPEQKEIADEIYGHIKNPADRYFKYAENKVYMDQKRGQNRHFN
jgi:hypothetical protein